MQKKNKLMATVAVLGALGVGISGCAQTLTTHGQVIRESQLAELKVGETTREQVQVNLGSPSSKALFDDNRWIYVTSLRKAEPLKPNQLKERTVITLSFTDEGVLSKVDMRSKEDGKPVAISDRATPTQGQSLGIVDQLLENLGRGF